MRQMRWSWAMSVVVVCALFAAACGDSGGSGAASGVSGPARTAGTAGTSTTAIAGGTLTMGVYQNMPAGWDPAGVTSTYGTSGGIELAAFYDVLMRFDPSTGKYVGRVAQSFTANADSTLWTLKLRPGVKFSDGTDYNADAVKFNVQRHIAPTSKSASKGLLTRFLDTTTVVDPLTVEFKLKEAWAGFPTLLAREVGMIASPTAIAKAGASFASAPGNAGAGPFLLTSYKPNESVEMARNPNYFGGAVYLDELKFIAAGTPQAGYETLKAGGVQAVYIRDPQVIATAAADKTPVLTLGLTPMSAGVVMNSGAEITCNGGQPAASCAGKADGTTVQTTPITANPKVRQAVAAALDVSVINQRVWNGTAKATTELFPAPLAWSPSVPGPTYDLAKAKQLVQEVKATGWDGKIRVLVPNTVQSVGLTVKTLLELAGMSVVLTDGGDTASVVQAVLTKHDYDIANWSLGFSDDPNNVYAQTSVSFTGSPTRYGYSNPGVDAGLHSLSLATSTADAKAAMQQIATALSRDVPLVSFTIGEEKLLMSAKLNGVLVDGQWRVDLDKAWLSK